jgi:hypothetical protein
VIAKVPGTSTRLLRWDLIGNDADADDCVTRKEGRYDKTEN